MVCGVIVECKYGFCVGWCLCFRGLPTSSLAGSSSLQRRKTPICFHRNDKKMSVWVKREVLLWLICRHHGTPFPRTTVKFLKLSIFFSFGISDVGVLLRKMKIFRSHASQNEPVLSFNETRREKTHIFVDASHLLIL